MYVTGTGCVYMMLRSSLCVRLDIYYPTPKTLRDGWDISLYPILLTPIS